MAIPKRGAGVPPRGSGGSGGGEIAVGVTDNSLSNELSSNVKKIIWATDALGFSATLHPDQDGVIVIGNPPEFIDPISWSSAQTVNVRVSESDTNEADSFLTGGLENTVVKGSTNNFRFSSTKGRGFGTNARLTVKTYHNNTEVDNVVFVANSNGSQNDGNVSISITNYASDGDGSAFTGKFSVTVDADGVIGSDNSGACRVELSFLEHKWGERRDYSQNVFRDKNPNTPLISGDPAVSEDADPANRVLKYISGVAYYTTGSPFLIEVPDIDNHNEDSSRPSESLMIDSSDFGITSYNTSPWTNSADWDGVTNLDTSSGIGYSETKTINEVNFRHVSGSKIGNIIRDSWSSASNKESNIINLCIDTFPDNSTDLIETFNGESKRLKGDYVTPWDSTQTLVDGEAVVFGGSLLQGNGLFSINEGVEGVTGSANNLSTYLPNETTGGVSKPQPDYSGSSGSEVFFREFRTTNTTTSYPNMTLTITTRNGVENDLTSGGLKIYLWKLSSTATSSPNLTLPPAYDPLDRESSKVNSIWVHKAYNFASFDDGATQSAATSGAQVNLTGNTITVSFGGSNVKVGVLARVEITNGVIVDHIVASF